MIFDLSAVSEPLRSIVQDAVDACDFPWMLLAPQLKQEVNRLVIPVDEADLSRWGRNARGIVNDHSHGHDHSHGNHVLYAGTGVRRAALGLAWYSGKVSLEKTLYTQPDLAKEVFLAEAAHMVDFFYMSDAQRDAIKRAYHDEPHEQHAHEDWFEEGGVQDYWSWVGESFMSGFMRAYAPRLARPLEIRQPWVHKSTDDIARQIREALTPAPEEPELSVKVFGDKDGKTYHDIHRHPHISRDIEWNSPEEAEEAGRQQCRVCKPKKRTKAVQKLDA